LTNDPYPRTAEEIELASALVRSAPQFEPPTRFVYLSLVEPPKAEVLATAGAPWPARLVKAVLRSPSRRATYEVVISLDDRAIASIDVPSAISNAAGSDMGRSAR
jgi:Cu2+-containing amine oxidase